MKQRAAVLIQQTGSHHIKLLALCCPHSTGRIVVARQLFDEMLKAPLDPHFQALARLGQARQNGVIKVAKLGYEGSYFGDLQSQHWGHIPHIAIQRQGRKRTIRWEEMGLFERTKKLRSCLAKSTQTFVV